MKKILILGAGMVIKPMVEYLLENKIPLVLASPMKERADSIIGRNPLGTAVDWSMDDRPSLDRMTEQNDLVVSLLPFKYHAEVARICIKHRRSLITTSYVQPEMSMLNDAATGAGVMLLNELGLDPGIDHMTAMKIIDYIHLKGGKVDKFFSLCGALPAPEHADNPLGYKFTWSPRGVILASRNSALYLKDGKEIFIDSDNLFKDRFGFDFPGLGDLEVYPNRDSISYMHTYDIPEVKTMYRGTFRYKGWCETLDAMKTINMLDDRPKEYEGMTYAGFIAERADLATVNLKKRLAEKLGLPESSAALNSLDYLGFFENEMLPYQKATPFEITTDRMTQRMMLHEHERDVVLLKHIVLASYPNGKKEVIKSTLTDWGSPSTNTAVARTVALPAAIAARLILENKIMLTGVHQPVIPHIYVPVLNELKKAGISMNEEYGLPESEVLDF